MTSYGVRPRPGAIVIGGDYQGLGIVRSLGRRGIRVLVVDDEPCIAWFSRYAQATVRVPSLSRPDATLDALEHVGRQHDVDGWVLYPTRDEMVATIARNHDDLSGRFRLATPPWDVTRFACDKSETYELATRLGVPTPRTSCPQSLSDLDQIDFFPVVVKPRMKDTFVRLTGAKAWRADSLEQLRVFFERARSLIGDEGVIVQELIPGGSGTMHGFCAFFDKGRARGRMVTLYTRQHPPDFGLSCTCVETIASSELDEPSLRLLRGMGYSGLVELEYRRDPRDGLFKLLDINARTWGYHALGSPAGVDFAYMLYCSRVGLEVEDRDARPGVAWIRLLTDLPTATTAMARKRLTPREWARSLAHVRVESVLARDDVLPALAEVVLLPKLVRTKVVKPRRLNKVTER